MTFLAHWKFDEIGLLPATCYDSQAGGSGAHHGTYGWTGSYFGVRPIGVYGKHCIEYRDSTNRGGRVYSIQNLADLRIYGEMTIMCWLFPILGPSYIAIINGSGETEDLNFLWDFVWGANLNLVLGWEYGPTAIDVYPTTANDFLTRYQWQHIAARRREVGGGPNLGVDFFKNGAFVSTDDNSGAGWPPPTGGGNTYANLNANLNYEYNPSHHGISSLRLYDEALSDVAIDDIYDAELALFESSWSDGFVAAPSVQLTDMGIYGELMHSGALNPRINTGFHR